MTDTHNLAALAEAVEELTAVAHKAYVAATMEAVNAGGSHPLKAQMEAWRLRCLRAGESGHDALAVLRAKMGISSPETA